MTLRVEIEGARRDQAILPEANLGAVPAHVIHLRIPNHPPRLQPLVAKDAGGRRVKVAEPGDQLTLEAVVEDRDGDALRFRWVPSGGSGKVDDPRAATDLDAPRASGAVRVEPDRVRRPGRLRPFDPDHPGRR